jgi:hypothetical protein
VITDLEKLVSLVLLYDGLLNQELVIVFGIFVARFRIQIRIDLLLKIHSEKIF